MAKALLVRVPSRGRLAASFRIVMPDGTPIWGVDFENVFAVARAFQVGVDRVRWERDGVPAGESRAVLQHDIDTGAYYIEADGVECLSECLPLARFTAVFTG